MRVQLLQVGPADVCCYLVWDEDTGSCALIDPGGDADVLRDYMAEEGLTLRHIFLTHLHFDHIGAVDELRTEDVPVWVCPAELEGDTRMSYQLMDLTLPLAHYDEGDTITMDNVVFEILRTPGHTPGSVCLLCDGVAIFTGDTLFAGTYGRVDFPGGSAEEMAQSLRRLAELDGSLTVFSGHSGPTTIAEERRRNPYMLEALQ